MPTQLSRLLNANKPRIADYMTPPNAALLSHHVPLSAAPRNATPCAAVQRLRAAVLSPALLCRAPTLQISLRSALPLQPKRDWAKHCPYNNLHSLLDLCHAVYDAATRIRGDSIPCFAVPLCATSHTWLSQCLTVPML